MEKKTILITGGAGYIGSHAVVAFEQAGYKTVILDNLVNSSKETLAGIEKILGYCPDFYECDIRDKKWLEAVFGKYEFDGVIHFAGLKAVGESCKNIHEYQENNVIGSITLFGVMQQFQVKKIVFSSSATVYRSDNTPPFTEDMSTGTTNPYGTTKLVTEKLLEDYSTHAEWSVVNLRYFNPIGTHPSWYIGEIPNGTPNNILPYLLDVATWKREKMFIFGEDYPTPDGTGVRDYIDVCDVVDAHIVAYQKFLGGIGVFNIGTGRWTSVKEIIAELESVIGKSIPKEVTGRRSGDLAAVYASCNRALKEFWWQSTRSLKESLQNSWNFVSKL
jgi:UDP-glucose 4-epimerase